MIAIAEKNHNWYTITCLQTIHLKYPQSVDKDVLCLQTALLTKSLSTVTTWAKQVMAPLVERKHRLRSFQLAQAHFLEEVMESGVDECSEP